MAFLNWPAGPYGAGPWAANNSLVASNASKRRGYFRADTSAVEASRARVEAAAADGHAHYGINTGFGALANTRIPDDQLAKLQRNLLLSHAVGVGDPVPADITLVMLRL